MPANTSPSNQVQPQISAPPTMPQQPPQQQPPPQPQQPHPPVQQQISHIEQPNEDKPPPQPTNKQSIQRGVKSAEIMKFKEEFIIQSGMEKLNVESPVEIQESEADRSKSSLNPDAKEFVMNPNAKEFVMPMPKSTPTSNYVSHNPVSVSSLIILQVFIFDNDRFDLTKIKLNFSVRKI